MSAVAERFAAGFASVRGAVESHPALILNASWLACGTVATAVLGFAYWLVAARYFALEPVGLAAAGVSIMNVIALLGQLGLGTILISEIKLRGDKAEEVVSAALAVCFAAAVVLGTVFLGVAHATSFNLGAITGTAGGGLVFVLGCGATCAASVLSSACIGHLRSSLQTYQNVFFSMIKLVLLVLVADRYSSEAGEEPIFAAWVVAQAASICFFFILYLKKFNGGTLPRPCFKALRSLVPTSLSHHILDMVIQTPGQVMPFLVAVIVSPAVNAAFNAGYMILRVVNLLPAAFSTTLFALGNSSANASASGLRFTISVVTFVGFGVITFIAMFSDTLLNLFNPEYAQIASTSLKILSLSYFGVASKSLYLSVKRLEGRMLFASRVFAVGGCLELLLTCLGGHFWGLNGLSSGWTAATLLQAAYMVPAIFKAASNLKIRSPQPH